MYSSDVAVLFAGYKDGMARLKSTESERRAGSLKRIRSMSGILFDVDGPPSAMA